MSVLAPPDVVDAVLDVLEETVPELREVLADRRGATGGINPSGERQLAADVWADETLVDRLGAIPGVGEIATEEREGIVDCGEGLSLTVDPLDGSSNLTSNNLLGTIVGCYDAPLPAGGEALVGAIAVCYGPTTTIHVAADGQVREYVHCEDGLVCREDDLTLPEHTTVYGFGGRVPQWNDDFSSYVSDVESELKLRYGGAMIGDVNQVLTYGGIFSYPALEDRPNGKLRLQFEGLPMAYLIEAAGGRSSDGSRSLLERSPKRLHERTPVHLGNAELVERVERRLPARERSA